MAHIQFFVPGSTAPVMFESSSEMVFAWENVLRKHPKPESDWIEIRQDKVGFWKIPATCPFACFYDNLPESEPFQNIKLADTYDLLLEQWKSGKIFLSKTGEVVPSVRLAGVRTWDEYLDYAFERRSFERW